MIQEPNEARRKAGLAMNIWKTKILTSSINKPQIVTDKHIVEYIERYCILTY